MLKTPLYGNIISYIYDQKEVQKKTKRERREETEEKKRGEKRVRMTREGSARAKTKGKAQFLCTLVLSDQVATKLT